MRTKVPGAAAARQPESAASASSERQLSSARAAQASTSADAAMERHSARTGEGLAARIHQSPRMLAQRQAIAQQQPRTSRVGAAKAPTQRSAQGGLPDALRAGVESLSGMDMSDVQVHRNSAQPAQLNAHAFAQGNQIHLAPGQERHLPHEAWHVVQQRQGRVRPTMQMKGSVSVNDDQHLEREADAMGRLALTAAPGPIRQKGGKPASGNPTHLSGQEAAIAQLKPTLAQVTWETTHAVKEVDGSLYGKGGFEEGEIGPWGELRADEVVLVDDEDIFISRRGANQEKQEIREEHGKQEPQVEWIRALKIKGINVRGLNVYIRRETLHCGDDVSDPEAHWTPVVVDPEVSWNDDKMLDGVQKIGLEYEQVVNQRGAKPSPPLNVCSTPDMDQIDEGLDVATEFQVKDFRDLSGYGPGAKTLVAYGPKHQFIGVMQITIEGVRHERYLYVKWLLGSLSSRGAGVALVRKALEYAIEQQIHTVKVDSAMSAVDFYSKRGFVEIGKAQHMNDSEEDSTLIDCGCSEMQLQFYWRKA